MMHSAVQPVSDVLPLLSSLREIMSGDVFCEPCFPAMPLAVGDAAVDAPIDKHSQETLLVVESSLYAAEDLCVIGNADGAPLCNEAATVVTVLRQQRTDSIFNRDGDSRIALKSHPCSGSCPQS